MKTTHWEDAPQRFKELWPWLVAVDSWLYCDEEPLAKIIQEEDIPEEFKRIISQIISGERKQKKRAASKLKIPACERMEIAKAIDLSLYFIEEFLYAKVSDNLTGEVGVSLCTYVGDRDGNEPIEEVEYLYSMQAKALTDASSQLNVSVDTIKNLLRDMRSYIRNWPLV